MGVMTKNLRDGLRANMGSAHLKWVKWVLLFCLIKLWMFAPAPLCAMPDLQEDEDGYRVTYRGLEIRWDRSGFGGPSQIKANGVTFTLEDRVPFYAEVWEVLSAPPLSDRLHGTMLEAALEAVQWDSSVTDDGVAVRSRGGFSWPSAGDNEKPDRLEWMVEWKIQSDRPGVQVSWQLLTSGAWQQRKIRELSWQLPLGLDPRKRVAQGGDRGVHWNTRYYYNYIVRPHLFEKPEVNIWRHFTVEQEAPETFRIWRAQSDRTTPLLMQRGEQAAGWIGVYDQRGGYFAAYSELSSRAPKALRVDAAGEGLLRMQMVPPTSPAIHPHDPEFGRMVSGMHDLELLPFAGEWDLAQKSASLRKLWMLERLGSDPLEPMPPDTGVEPWDDWLSIVGDARKPLVPVAGGIPLPRGEVDQAMGFRVFLKGNELPVQWRPLAFWPDGSVKWAELVFPLNPAATAGPGMGDGDAFDVEVTLRDGSSLPLSVMYGFDVRPADVLHAVTTIKEDAEVRVQNGPLEMVLREGVQWLGKLQRNGRDILHATAGEQAFVDYLHLAHEHVNAPYRPLDTHAQGEVLSGPLRITDVRVEESGPIRAVVRLAGETDGDEPVRITLRLECYAGSEWIRIWKSVDFLDADIRERMVSRMGLSLPLRLDPSDLRMRADTMDTLNEHPALASLHQFSPRGYRWATADALGMVEDTHTGNRSHGWTSVADSALGATVVQRYFWQEAPRENRIETMPTTRLSALFWPEASAVMDVRRYSDFPHSGQGESAGRGGRNNDWVYNHWYEADPFTGISKTYETLWGFHDPNIPVEKLSSVAADFHSRPLIYAGAERYQMLGVALPSGNYDKFPDINRNLDNVADFWLYNQRLWDWYGPWQHGDTVHGFRSGYGFILPADVLGETLALPDNERFEQSFRPDQRILDYTPNNGWTFDNGRWGWSMTEKLPAQFWQMQYLRTGRRDVFFQAEAIAANSRDVVIRQYGRWFGRGTRHGVQHWSCGNHEERQTVHLEFRHHYLLTGDRRTEDVNERLTREYYLQSAVSGVASPSGRLPGLLAHWERTGDERSLKAFEAYIRAMLDPDGIRIPTVVFPQGEVSAKGPLNNPTMFFHTFGAMHAVLEYYYLTDNVELREQLREGLVRMADYFVDTDTLYAGGLVIAFAAKHADEPEKYLEALNRYALEEGNNWRFLFQTVTENPAHWTGPSATLWGAATTSWSRLNKVPYWTSVWDVQPAPGEQRLEIMEALEANGRAPRMDVLELSWQSEFDDPEFDFYFDRWRPWSENFHDPARHAESNQ